MLKTSLCTAALLIALSLSANAKTLVFCSEGNPEAINPQIVTTTTGMNAGRPIFNNLVEFEPGTTVIKPSLAKTWEISADGTEYVFHLREGVKFHSNAVFKPTRTVNADDVIFSLERQWKTDHPFHNVSGAQYDYFQDIGMPDILKSIEKIDDMTVKIVLTRAEAPFLANLAMDFNVVHSAEYADQMLKAGTPEKLDTEPVGTGPFQFISYQKDVSIRYRAFPDYWAGKQPIDTLVFSITPHAGVRLTKLKAGECHVMAFPDPHDVDAIKTEPNLKLLSQEGLNIGYMALNVTKPPLDNVLVRRAINMAVDKVSIMEAVYRGAGVIAKNPIPPTMWSYNDDIKDYPYDLEDARKLMAQAGLARGFETDLWYMPVSRAYNPDGKRIAELIQIDLAKIGIKLNLVTYPWEEYRAKLQQGEAPMALFGWTGDNGDPDNFLNVLLGCTAARIGGNNVAKWCDRDYDTLITKAKATSDRAEREKLYRQAQEIVKREAPWVPIAHSIVFTAIRKNVQNYKMDPLGRHPFEGVDLSDD
jgi:dipeptide transport system substrate-binding protein